MSSSSKNVTVYLGRSTSFDRVTVITFSVSGNVKEQNATTLFENKLLERSIFETQISDSILFHKSSVMTLARRGNKLIVLVATNSALETFELRELPSAHGKDYFEKKALELNSRINPDSLLSLTVEHKDCFAAFSHY